LNSITKQKTPDSGNPARIRAHNFSKALAKRQI